VVANTAYVHREREANAASKRALGNCEPQASGGNVMASDSAFYTLLQLP